MSYASPDADAGAPGAARELRHSRTVAIGFVLLVLFVVVFPKGGVKPAGIPLTWGYMLIALAAAASLASLASPGRRAAAAYGWTLPFQAIVVPLCIAAAMGARGSGLGYVFSTLLNFAVFPFVFYILFSGKLRRLAPTVLARALVWAVRAIAVYGLVLFGVKVTTGSFIEIPYLTVNVGDVGELEATKMIMRTGEISKLISTYNNGNIYGICLGMMLPLYLLFERSRVFQVVVWLSLFFTISRTAWFGGLFLIVLLYFIGDRPTPRRLAQGVVLVAVGAAAISFLLDAIGRDVAYLFDPTLGGRTVKYDELWPAPPLLPTGDVGGFGEIPYLGVLKLYGLVGLLAFLPLLVAPPLIGMTARGGRHPVRVAARRGLYAYLFMALSDGAILLIPVMAIFHFVALLALEGHVVETRRPREGGTR